MTTAPTVDSPRSTAQEPGVSPDAIIRIASGFMSAKHLFAANELGLFEALGDAPATLEGLAARTGLTPRAARISADAMVALGLLERQGDTYANGTVAAAYLTGATPADLRPFLRFWDRLSYPAWEGLAHALASGPHREMTEMTDLSEELQRIASEGIDAVLTGPSRALAGSVDFAPFTSLADVGGGTGSWAIAITERYPHLQATVLDLPSVVPFAQDRIARAGLGSRVTAHAVDVMDTDLAPGHDVFLVANLAHYWTPEDNRKLLSRLRRAAAVGARLLLADFWTDPTHTEPVHAALMAGEFAVHVRDGDVYSVDEVRDWLTATGWRFVEHVPLAGPQSLVVAEAV